MEIVKPSPLFHRKLTTQTRNISDKKTTTTKIYLSVIFWLVCFPLFAQVPSITSFSPTEGPVGTSVIISGANFSTTPANNTVFFGATEATVTAAAADQLTVDVPAGTTYAPITVMVNGLMGYSSDPFVVTFTSPIISATTYAPYEEHTTGSSPRMLASGDLDGDGKPDVVVVNGSSYTVSIFKNSSTTGSVSYEPKIDLTTGTNPSAVALGDLDGDGKLDLVVVNQNDNTLSVFRNTSTGSTIDFDDRVEFTTDANPIAVALGDLDGDGKTDLVTANWGNDNISVLRNTSVSGVIDATSFATKVDFATGALPYALAIADLDGDSKVDVVVVNRNDDSISTLLNTSTSGVIDANSLAAKIDKSTGIRPYAVAIGDLDDDGMADLAVVNYAQQNVSVFKNTSTGTGAISYSRMDFHTATSPSSVAIGDLDGDGKPDIAAGSLAGSVVSLFKNMSTSGTIDASSFSTKTDISSGYYHTSVVLCDQDGDHKPDILVNNQTSNTFSVLRHTGSDTATDMTEFSFSEQTGEATINAAAHTVDIEVEFGTDLTALVATFSLSAGGSAEVSSIAQESATTSNDFTDPVVYTITAGDGATIQEWIVTVTTEEPSTETDIVSFSLAEQTTAAEINATAHTVDIEVFSGTDLTALIATFSLSTVVTSAEVGGVAQISGTTPNDFANPVTYTVIAEDGVTTQDWVVTLTVAPPVVGITSFSPTSGPAGTSVTITGENFDATPANNVVYFGGSRAEVTAASASELTVTVPPGATYKPITVLTNGLIAESHVPFELTFTSAEINSHSFAASVDIEVDSELPEIELGDIDNDGLLDLALANGLGTAVSTSVLKNASTVGGINYEPQVELTTGSSQHAVAFGDLDGDGKLDLAAVSFLTNTVLVFRNISTTGTLDANSFDDKVEYSTGTSPQSIAIADLDGDGKLDLAVGNRSGNSVSIFENTSTIGTIGFADKVDYTTGSSPRSVAVQDLDDDERPDLVLANRSHNTLSVLKNTSTIGTINFAAKVDFDAGTDPEYAVIGDLDGDDKPDLIVANYGENTVSVLMNTTTSGILDASSFASKVDFATGSGPRAASLGDLNGDGKQDIAVANGDNSSVSVLMNTSSSGVIDNSSFAEKVDFDTENDPQSVAVGDIDGDGKNDLVTGNRFSVSLFRHTRTDTEILAFSLPDQTGPASIDSDNHTITIEIDYTPDISGLIPTFTLSDEASVAVNGTDQESGTTANDFTETVIYTVSAEDKTTTQDWAVTVTLAPNTATDINDFSVPDQVGEAVIDAEAHTVGLEAFFDTDVSSLVSTFTLSYGATAKVNNIVQESGTTANDFTNPLIYSIMAEDGTTSQVWTVSVTLVPNDATDFTSFTLPEQTEAAAINESDHSIAVEVPFGTDVTSLVATFTLSSGATAKVNGSQQTSGRSSNDFTNPVVYTVTAGDGSTQQDWEVVVTVKDNGMPTVAAASFSIDEDAPLDEFVGQVSATDPDDDELTYSIKSGNEGGVFKIDEITGEISVAAALDFETTSQFNLVIEVEDGKGGASTATIIVNLNDIDEVPVLGMDNDAIRSVDIYPNPVSSLLTIRWHKFDRAILRDFSGQAILTSSQRILDIKDLPSGVYIMTLKSNSDEFINFRIIKK